MCDVSFGKYVFFCYLGPGRSADLFRTFMKDFHNLAFINFFNIRGSYRQFV